MLLTKDGITVDVSHPADIQRYRTLGYVRPGDVPEAPEEDAPEEVAEAPEAPADRRAELEALKMNELREIGRDLNGQLPNEQRFALGGRYFTTDDLINSILAAEQILVEQGEGGAP